MRKPHPGLSGDAKRCPGCDWGSRGRPSRRSAKPAGHGGTQGRASSGGADARDGDLFEDVRGRDGAVGIAGSAGLEFR
jgi:hypothetical protein